jgi:hypothetical protein
MFLEARLRSAISMIFSAAAMVGAPRLLIAPFIDIDAPANAATVDTSDNDRLNLEIWYVVRNVRGEDVSHNSKLYNVNLNAAYLAQLQTSGIGYNGTLELPPGQYGLRVVVRDNITGKVGSVWAPLRVD